MKRFYLILTLFFSTALASYGQEDCANGLDDDGDGFVDCWDADCVFNQNCEDSPLRPTADCQTPPNELPEFGMELDWASSNGTAFHQGRIAIGDIDRDGVPEVVTNNRYGNNTGSFEYKALYVLSGLDGSIEHKLQPANRTPSYEMAIANLDDDNCGEIFTYLENRGNYYLASYDCELNLIWESQVVADPGNFGLADFDGDGQVELYTRDQIRDAKTGTIIINGSNTSVNDFEDINGAPVAVDVLNTGQLQLVVGDKIYSVNLGTRTANSGTLTLERTMPATPEGAYFTKRNSGFYIGTTSVADYNLDGFLDIVATGALNKVGGITTVFLWDVQNDEVKYFYDTSNETITTTCPAGDTDQPYISGWENGTGRVNMGDLDGDGLMNASFLSGKYLYSLDENFELVWKIEVKEETSGITGCTLFDFNGDGKTEVVYRDEDYLYIINGTDGSINTQTRCVSRTAREYPIVVDVDNDGETEICVVCGTDNEDSADNFCDNNYMQNSQVRVFRTSREPWVPSRNLWNQHAYFNVNVNDDLTIPTNQQKHHLLFSDAVDCFVGGQTQGRLTVSSTRPPTSMKGAGPVYASPDLDIVDNSLEVEQPSCPDRDFSISFQITNAGDIQLSGDVPISFYNGDPEQPGATYLGQSTVTLTDFGEGEILTITGINITGPGDEFTLYIVINDNGTTLPTPISLPNTDILECDYDNIASVLISPTPFPLSTDKQNFIKCLDAVVPGNGYASAYRDINGTPDTDNYDFYWFDQGSDIDINNPDYVGPIYNGLDSGTYSVFAVHKTAQCSSDTVEVRIDVEATTPEGTLIIEDVDITACLGELGALSASVVGGLDENQYDYEWYKGAASIPTVDPVFATGREISNLTPDVYKVLVTEKTTGCSLLGETTIDDLTENSDLSASAKDINCSNDNSGEVSASVGGDTTSFTFYWYEGITVSNTLAFTGNRIGNLGTGDYTVFAVDTATGCSTDTLTVNINRTTPPEFNTTSTPQTFCSGLSGTASVIDINVDDYLVEWFIGANTTGTPISNQETISGQAAGTYTVRVTDNLTGCSTFESVTITEDVFIPTLSATPYSQTQCENDGTVPFDANGAIKAMLSDNENPDDYTFEWTDEDGAIITQAGDSISNLNAGVYSVVATHNLTGCITNEVTITIEDLTPEITIILTGSSLPNDCDEDSGSISLSAYTVDNDSLSGVGFTFEWYNGIPSADSTAFHTESNTFTSTATELGSGNYTVTVTDQSTGCSKTEVYVLPFIDGPELALDSVTNTTTCTPNNDGTITVTLTAPDSTYIYIPSTTDSVLIDESFYMLKLYEGALTIADTVDNTPIDSITGTAGVISYTFYDLEPGAYSIFALETDSLIADGQCDLVGAVVGIVGEDASDPIINGLSENNFTCVTAASDSAASANGQITVTINGENGTDPDNYFLNWYIGADNTGELLENANYGSTSTDATNAYATGLPGGTYTLEVIDTLTLCSTARSFSILDLPPPLAVSVATDNYYRCDRPTGSARVDSVWENGVLQTITGQYSFRWLYDDGSGNQIEFTDSTASSIHGLASGTYYIEVTNEINECLASLVEFEILDETLDKPVVALADLTNPTVCIQPFDENRESELVAVVIEDDSTYVGDPSIYSFQWFEGTDTSTTPIAFTSTIHQDDIPELVLNPLSKDSASYTVMVTDTAGCTDTGTYTLELEDVPITISAGSTPVTRCDTIDGSVYAIVTSAPEDEARNNYSYTWIDSENDTLANSSALDIGTYRVIATDLNNSYCVVEDTITVENGILDFEVNALAIQPNTNCEDSLANGIVSANVDGEFVGYTFIWGEILPEDTVEVGTGPQVGNLGDGDYIVEAINDISMCRDSSTVTLDYLPTGTLPPSIRVLSDQVNCNPDVDGYTGQLFAYVLESDSTENTQDYIFTWYEGQDATGEILEVSLGSGVYNSPVLSDVPAGFYTVRATNILTGCFADATGQIIEDLETPDIALELGASNCNKENGYAFIQVENDIEVESIIWYDENGNVITIGPRLEEVSEGTYFVTITTPYGCSLDTSLVIPSIINPYNGISRNGDGLNDYFEIACIEDFPNNIVTIFNRAGQKVYEIEGYSNEDAVKRFEGMSNRGVSVMGNELPSGTYFYIIDKRNGEDKLAGYLELR